MPSHLDFGSVEKQINRDISCSCSFNLFFYIEAVKGSTTPGDLCCPIFSSLKPKKTGKTFFLNHGVCEKKLASIPFIVNNGKNIKSSRTAVNVLETIVNKQYLRNPSLLILHSSLNLYLAKKEAHKMKDKCFLMKEIQRKWVTGFLLEEILDIAI